MLKNIDLINYRILFIKKHRSRSEILCFNLFYASAILKRIMYPFDWENIPSIPPASGIFPERRGHAFYASLKFGLY